MKTVTLICKQKVNLQMPHSAWAFVGAAQVKTRCRLQGELDNKKRGGGGLVLDCENKQSLMCFLSVQKQKVEEEPEPLLGDNRHIVLHFS